MTSLGSSENSKLTAYDLAVDSSSQVGSLALGCRGVVLGVRESTDQRSHSEVLNDLFADLLSHSGVEISQLKHLVVGNGPGSFTGVRVALSFVKSLAMAKNLPIFVVDSTYNLAWQVRDQGPGGVVTIQNAFKNMVYLAVYDVDADGHLTILEEPRSVAASELELILSYQKHRVERLILVGDGLLLYQSSLTPELRNAVKLNADILTPSAKTALEIFYHLNQSAKFIDWRELQALYVRESEADEKFRLSGRD